MTEAEWLACEDWRRMLAFLSGRWTQRKAFLYVCAGLRSLWELLYDEGSQYAVEVAEHAADGAASEDEIRDAGHYAETPTFGVDLDLNDEQARSRLYNTAHIAYHCLSPCENGDLDWHLLEHLSEQKEWPGGWLIREILGNPFNPLTISSAWLSWNDGIVFRLTQSAYDDRILPAGTLDNTRLLILADALEEAGCTDEQILTHLRGGGEHYRGCWVIDMLLGKQ